MVGRLVEQQEVGLGEQDRGQRHPHPPPAGQIVERPALHRVVEAEPGEDARGAAGRRISVDLDQPGLDLGGAQWRRPGFALGQQAGALAIGGEHRFVRGRGSARRLLGEKPDPAAARQVDRAVLRLQDAADQVEQGGFADAVAADQPDLGAFRDLGIRPVEQCPTPVDAVGHFKKGQHRGLIPRGYSRARLCRFDLSGRAWTAAEVLLGQQPARRAGGSAAAPAVRSGSCRRSPASR